MRRFVGCTAHLLVLLLCASITASAAAAQSADPVAARDLPRGITLQASDIEYVGGARAAADAGVPGPGWVTRRVISRGEPLREPAVGRPQLVRAGEEVEAIWNGGAIQLRIRGTAMGAAAAGERVMIRIDTRRRIEGVAVGPRLVHISGESR